MWFLGYFALGHEKSNYAIIVAFIIGLFPLELANLGKRQTVSFAAGLRPLQQGINTITGGLGVFLHSIQSRIYLAQAGFYYVQTGIHLIHTIFDKSAARTAGGWLHHPKGGEAYAYNFDFTYLRICNYYQG